MEQQTTAQVVTATKQSKESSEEEEHFTGSNLSEFQVKTSTLSSTNRTLPSLADPRFDTKMEHLHEKYFLAIGANHEV